MKHDIAMRAARFYEGSPTGQYDAEAADALRAVGTLYNVTYVTIDGAGGSARMTLEDLPDWLAHGILIVKLTKVA